MQHLAADFDTLIQQFNSGRAWWQLGIVVAGFAAAWLFARLVRAKLPADLEPGALKIGAGSVHRLVLPLFALIFVWVGTFALSKWQPVTLLRIAIPLIASFVVIRLVVYLLRHVVRPSPALKASERIIAYGVWGILAFYLTGILPEISSALDDVNFVVGTKKISLLLILHAVFWSVFTVFVALAISSIVERRLMSAVSLDMSMLPLGSGAATRTIRGTAPDDLAEIVTLDHARLLAGSRRDGDDHQGGRKAEVAAPVCAAVP